MKNKNTYNQTYKVKPRYFSAYQRQGLYIITFDKAIYTQTLKTFLRLYANVKIAKEGKAYIIKAKVKK